MCALTFAVGCEESFGKPFDSGFDEPDAGAPGKDAAAPRQDAAMNAGDTGTMSPDDDAAVSSPDAGGDPVAQPAQLPSLLAVATCDALERCIDPLLLNDQLAGRNCVKLHEGRFAASDLRYLPDSVAAGLVLWDPDFIGECLGDVRLLGCDVKSSRLPFSCDDAFAGTVAIGDECTINEDCEGDAFCDKGAGATCPGTCAALQGLGMPCSQNDDAQCEDGLVCFRGSCEPLGELDDKCGGDQPGCRPGLECADDGSGPACVDLDAIYTESRDAPCDVTGPLCVPPFVCASTMGTEGVCAATVGADAPCVRAVPNQCPAHQYCDADIPGAEGTCRDRPGRGEDCLDRQEACADQHACVDGVCLPIGGVGTFCATAAECYSGECDSDGTCAAPLQCQAP